ncbi:MAG: S66 peptidase family protein [Thermoanaerobaculia bacterium]
MLNRRDLAKGVALSGAAAFVAVRPAAAQPPSDRRPAPIKPPKLSEGDTVGLVLPARMAFEPSHIDLARRQLEALGFAVKLGENAYARDTYLAGTDEQRAADLNSMFADPEVDGIFCYTGGWGTPRILPLLDYPLIRDHPKVLIGFSDITALVNAVYQETGVVTFHGPTAAGQIRPWTREQMRRVIQSSEPIGTLGNPPKEEKALVNWDYPLLTVRGGRARGRLVGGNLTLVCALMGTPWELDTRGAILLLEDVEEDLYRIDRMLTQLYLAGKLREVAGVVFGDCSRCDPGEGTSFSLEQILRHWLQPLGVPVLSGLAFGHVPERLTLPIGLEATLDADAGTLTLDEPAVT